MHYVRRGGNRRLTGGVSRVFDILDGQRSKLGIESVVLGKTTMKGGGHFRVRIRKVNGSEVDFIAEESALWQKIRVATKNQHQTMLLAARALRNSNIPICFEGLGDDRH